MSREAKEYVDGWIVENIHLLAEEPESDETIARRLAILCSIEADLDGISVPAIEAAVGNLVHYIADALVRHRKRTAN
jgi:hypothetical protein